jgi:hypothetical protein
MILHLIIIKSIYDKNNISYHYLIILYEMYFNKVLSKILLLYLKIYNIIKFEIYL